MSNLTGDAKYLMSNEAFQNALADAKKELIDQAMACTVSDHERRRLFLCLAKMADKLAMRIASLAVTQDELEPVADFYEQRTRGVLARFLK